MYQDEILADKHLILEGIIKDFQPQKVNEYQQFNDIEELLKGTPNIEVEQQSNQSKISIQPETQVEKQYTYEEIDKLLHQFTLGEYPSSNRESIKQTEQNKQIPYILDYVDQLEKEPYQVIQKYNDDSDLIQHYENQKQANNTFQEVKMDRKLKDLYSSIFQNDFRIKCITCFSSTIAIGTTKGFIYLISDKIVKLESDPSITVCPIICLRFNEDGQFLLAVSQQQILLYNKNKFCKAFQKMTEGIPLTMTMLNGNKDFFCQFLVCDSLGKVNLMKIRKNLFTYGIERYPIFQDCAFGVCHCCESIKIKDMQTVAFVYKAVVFVAIIEPKIFLIFKKKYEVKKRQLLCAKWQIESENPVLAVSNGKVIEIIKMNYENKEGKFITSFEVVLTYNLNDDVQFLAWMSDNILFLKNDRKKYSLIAISEITENNVLVVQSQLSQDVADQQIGEDKIQSFQNTICQNHNQLYYIQIDENGHQQQNIIHYQLITWQDYIEQLTSNHKWTECMGLCLYLYLGKQLKFAGLPKTGRQEFLRPYFNERLKQFVEISISHQTIGVLIPTIIEFMVTIQSYDYLFREIKSILQKHNLELQFYNSLEPFILKNAIKFIPDDSLKDIMIYLINQQKKLNILKQLIINLDIKLLDPIIIQQLCIENNLFTLLIYISPRVDEDYKTPLFKMYAVYRQLIKGDQTSLQKYLKSIQVDLDKNQSTIEKEIQLLGYKCLWNLHMLLIGELFPQQKIPENQWASIIAEILSWLLQYDTLEEFLKIDSSIFLNELLIIFTNREKYEQLEQHKITIANEQLQVNDLSLSEIVILLLEASSKKLNLLDQLSNFVYEIMKLGYPIKYEHFLNVVKCHFKDPYTNLQTLVEKSNYKFQHLEYFKLPDFNIQNKNIRDSVFVSYINQFKDKLINDQEAISIIIQEASCSELQSIRAKAQIYFIKDEWQFCLQSLLTSNNEEDKIFIFDYIEQMINVSQYSELRTEILKYVLSIVPQLVSICAEKLRQILQYYKEEDYKAAIEMLDSHPNLKLKLLSEIIQEKRNNKFLVEDKLMISFFKLICQYHPKDAYEQLQYGDFPQDECLRLCEEFQIMKGVAFLKERSGRYMEALNLYFDIISVELKKMQVIEYDQQSQIEQIQILILPCLKICRDNHSNEEESTSYWFTLVIRMVQLREEFKYNKNIFKSLNNVYQVMLEELLERVHLYQIIMNIKILFGSFTHLEELRRTFSKLLSSCSFELYNQQQLIRVLQLDYMKNLMSLFELQQIGVNFNPSCQTCFEIRNQYMLAFMGCSHLYHHGCAPKIQNMIVCEQCLTQNSYKLRIQLDSIVQKNGRQMPTIKMKNQEQIEDEEMTKEEIRMNRINKWKRHDIENEISEQQYY
ncbi:unnamed protein product [Paramecium octaurelia]|uniref:Vacuolar protein sorting-associated protein 8 central domain-containing protein n=1 Tax=Paramecium octaurelia TaxID=43137 RepID=A0A8S1WB55_PAROT|nr:unnamed protein product [Paramecium octaurelia]